MCVSALREYEKLIHKKYDDIKVEFQPKLVLSITVLRCRDVSVSYARDVWDTPDPQFRVSVPAFPSPNQFLTATKDDSPTAEINETFNFIVPPGFDPQLTPCLVQLELYDEDIIFDDYLGTEEFEVFDWTLDKSVTKTIVFGKHGEVDIQVTVLQKSHPDFRFGFGLCDEEREFRMKRLPIVHKCLQDVLGQGAPRGLDETPVVSLCTSGGGYRAIVAMTGAMEAFNDAGLMDAFTYITGLSGSAWYLESAYSRKGMTRAEQKDFHEFLKNAAQKNMQRDIFAPDNLAAIGAVLKSKKKYGLPLSLSDALGLTAGRIFLGEDHIAARQSEWQEYVGSGKVPFPLVVSLHVKNTQLATKFHAYMECSPYEVSYPNYGVGISSKNFGSVWNSGILARKCPEYFCHFHIGATGAVAGFLNTTRFSLGEKDEDFLKFVDKESITKRVTSKNTEDGSSTDSAELDEEDDDMDDAVIHDFPEEEEGNRTLLQIIKDTFITSRNSVISRTARVFNFSKNLDSLPVRNLNPFGETEFVGPMKEELIRLYGNKSTRHNMSTEKDVISIVDAAFYNNVPAVIALRPQRTTDLMIIIDFSSQSSDEDFSHLELFATAAHCWRDGLKFPPIDFREIARSPPTECMVFVDDNDDMCPVVIWFQLSNTKFKNVSDYKPRSNVTHDSSEGKFNEFAMFGPGTPYKALASGFSESQQDRLRELMYFNVSSNMKVIKDAITKATEIKRRRLQRQRTACRQTTTS